MSAGLRRGAGSFNASLSTEEYWLCQFVCGGVLTALMAVCLQRGTGCVSLSVEGYWQS